MYYVVLAIFLVAFLLIFRVIHSPFGNVLKAIRENEPRAISLGYDAERYKLLAFVLSATLSGLAGATKAIVFQLASLTDVHWTMSGEVVLMTLLGGMGTIFGPGRRRVHDHRPRELPGELRPVGDGHHRRHLRRLRAGVPARHRRRARRVVGGAQGLTARRGAVRMAAWRTFAVLAVRSRSSAPQPAAETLVVAGSCRDGMPTAPTSCGCRTASCASSAHSRRAGARGRSCSGRRRARGSRSSRTRTT